jgi:hypothetical protein
VSYEASTTVEKQGQRVRTTDHEMPAMCVIKGLNIRLVSYGRALGLVFGLVFALNPKTLHVSIKRISGYSKRTGGVSSIALAATKGL